MCTSLSWNVGDVTLDRSAASLESPEEIHIIIYNRGWCLAPGDGAALYVELEGRLARASAIAVPTITLKDDADGAPLPGAAAQASRVPGTYTHRLITGISDTTCRWRRGKHAWTQWPTSTAIDGVQ